MAPPPDAVPAAPLATARRTSRQRALLSAGATGSVLSLLVALFVGWGAFKLSSIEREDLSLDLPTGPAKNYLLVGSDSREKGHPKRGVTAPIEDRRPLADTIMVLRIDPASSRPLLLSLPRDLWVTRSSDGEKGRINAAYGEGPQSLIDTLRDELGVPIHHYIEVDFKGFEGIVDAIGGVPMWFDKQMRDFQSDFEVTETGCVVLDGYDALAFARSRHMQVREPGGTYRFDGAGDLGRISRQQFFIRRTIARVMDKAGDNPLTIKRLIDSGTDNVTLDGTLAITDVVRIGNKFSALAADDLVTYTLPATPRRTTGGAEVLELDEAKAEPILARFRSPDDPEARSTTTLVARDQVRVTVLNGSGAPGVASAAAQAMEAAGFTIDHWGNGDEVGRPTADRTVVHHATGREDAGRAVRDALAAGADLVVDASLAADATVVVLGADYVGVSAVATTTTTTSPTTTAAAPTTAVAPAITPVTTDPTLRATVLNSSGATGAAQAAADALQAAGVTIVRTGNGAELGRPAEVRTLVAHGPGGEAAAQALADRLAGGADLVADAGLAPDELVLFVGTDFSGVVTPPPTTAPAAPTTAAPAAPSTAGPTSSTTTQPPSSKPVGELPVGTPPPGESCG